MKRINLISCPRNLSTALMYSFAQRPDTRVLDEPIYAHYLLQSGADHPGREEIIQTMETDLQKIKIELLQSDGDKGILFIKNMSHHFYDIDESFILDLDNVIYIRDPRKIIASYAQVIDLPSSRDVGIQKQFELYQYLIEHQREVVILDSGELLKDPAKVLTELCRKLRIPFLTEMLHWQPGPRHEDGIWAKYWYTNVHLSTGFSKQKTSDRPLPEHLLPLYHESRKYYDRLFEQAIRA